MKKVLAGEALKLLMTKNISIEHSGYLNLSKSCSNGKEILENTLSTNPFCLLFLGYCRLHPERPLSTNGTVVHQGSEMIRNVVKPLFPEISDCNDIICLASYNERESAPYLRTLNNHLSARRLEYREDVWKFWYSIPVKDRVRQFLEIMIKYESEWINVILSRVV